MKVKFNIAGIQNTFVRRLVTVLVMPVLTVIAFVIFLISVLWDTLRSLAEAMGGNGSAALRFLGFVAVHNWLGSEAVKARNEAKRQERISRMFNRREA